MSDLLTCLIHLVDSHVAIEYTAREAMVIKVFDKRNSGVRTVIQLFAVLSVYDEDGSDE